MRYNDEQRQAALDCLAANAGDFRRTSTETGIAARTLRKWARMAQAQASSAELEEIQARLAEFEQYLSVTEVDDPHERLRDTMLVPLIRNAISLTQSMTADIETATLAQKASALNQTLGMILKLMDLVPFREQVIRVEFIDPQDGTAHSTPYWARKHSGEPDKV